MTTKQATVERWCRKGILSAVAKNGSSPPSRGGCWRGGGHPSHPARGMGERS